MQISIIISHGISCIGGENLRKISCSPQVYQTLQTWNLLTKQSSTLTRKCSLPRMTDYTESLSTLTPRLISLNTIARRTSSLDGIYGTRACPRPRRSLFRFLISPSSKKARARLTSEWTTSARRPIIKIDGEYECVIARDVALFFARRARTSSITGRVLFFFSFFFVSFSALSAAPCRADAAHSARASCVRSCSIGIK